MKRKVFFSFHYSNDNWRASQVRNMGKVSGDSTFSDNDWESVKEKTDKRISEWIEDQLQNTSCIVVLIGKNTADRKWINYEIKRAIELNKGLVGIYINRLKDSRGNQDLEGANPFENIVCNGVSVSNYVKCFKSDYFTSEYIYNDIKNNMENLIENAIINKPSTW